MWTGAGWLDRFLASGLGRQFLEYTWPVGYSSSGVDMVVGGTMCMNEWIVDESVGWLGHYSFCALVSFIDRGLGSRVALR